MKVLEIFYYFLIEETTNEYGMLENQGDVAILFCDICQFDKLIIS